MLKIFALLRGGAGTCSVEAPFSEIQVALAVLMLEMAKADFAEDPAENDFILNALQRQLRLTSEQVRKLVERARAAGEESLDLHQFTRRVNEECGREEKFALLEALWQLIHVDGVVDKYEEALMRRLTGLLRLSHREMIEAKLKVRQEIAVFEERKAGCGRR
jgi:uncharacterized tellurite resistance protein B-like protein